MTTRTQPLVLVVDDNAAGRYATVRMLKSAGFDRIRFERFETLSRPDS